MGLAPLLLRPTDRRATVFLLVRTSERKLMKTDGWANGNNGEEEEDDDDDEGDITKKCDVKVMR